MNDGRFEETKYHSIFCDMSEDSIEDVLIVSNDLIYDQVCESNRDYFAGLNFMALPKLGRIKS